MAAEAARLCLCVDDLGLDRSVAASVAELADLGRVNAVSCLVGGPAWAAAAPLARQLANDVDVGLHLDLTECPLTGSRRSLPALLATAFAGALHGPSIRAEIRAQLDAFEAGVGRPPRFVDGHQHVHQFPTIREQLVGEIADRYGRSLPWLRSTRRHRAAGAKAWVLQALGDAALRRLARAHGIRHNAHLLGVYGFKGEEAHHGRRLAAWLGAAGTGDVLMCHPARGESPSLDHARARQVEHRWLVSAAFGELLGAHRVTLQPLSRTLAAEA